MAKDKEATPAVQLEFYQTHYDVVRIMYMLPFFQIFLNIIRTKNFKKIDYAQKVERNTVFSYIKKSQ